jgi:hypothetical protein
MDHSELWQQIRLMTKMRLAIDMKSMIRHPDALQFDVRVPKRRRMTVRLNGKNLYDLEFGRVSMRTFEYAVLGTAEDVYAEDLNGALLRLAGLED